MNPDRWQRLKELFEAGLSRDPSLRSSFLEQECPDDPALRREVAALLSGIDAETEFLEKGVLEEAPELFEDETKGALSGKCLGPYEIQRKIGEGGMGVVYLAKDTRLDRPVAVKALPPFATRDSQQRERLRREAKIAARIAHPGIATVYSLEEYDGNLYLISEFISGHTLLEMLEQGAPRLDVVLDIAIQVAEALTTAHENGVIHRDLKPENLIRTPEGKVKVLDFGLARIQNAAEIAASVSRLTGAGMFLGTPAYSSPEQLLGGTVDFRTDIFSFGVVLYELASGVHPFSAADPVSTIARILEAEPQQLTRVNPACPPQLERILRRCLQKSPSQRYATTRELCNDLTRLRQSCEVKEPVLESGENVISESPQLWWWRFHQACAAGAYYLMLYPLWRAKQWTPGWLGSLFFFAALVAVGIAANLRFHLWFTSSAYPAELMSQRRRVAPWIRGADMLFVAALFLGFAAIHDAHAIIGTLLAGAGVGSLVAFALIEPTTTRAAFKGIAGT